MKARKTCCRVCGRAVRYIPRRFAWVHDTPGADHAPIPETCREEETP